MLGSCLKTIWRDQLPSKEVTMSLTINHQTNDISATSGSVTIDGSAVGGGGGGPVTLGVKTIGGFNHVPPIDLGYFSASGLNITGNSVFYAPWVAPADGTIDELAIYISSNTVSASSELALGMYSNSQGPYSRLSYGTFDPNGAGTGWKSVTGLSQSVTANTIYWLAVSASYSGNLLQARSYRRNAFYPRPDTATVNDDRSISSSSQQVSSMSQVPTVGGIPSLGSTSNEPFLLVAVYS